MKYGIIEAIYPSQLTTLVNKSIENGWELYGNTFFADGRFYQPMVKKEES